jgi:spectinomycin phosphotransferase
MPEPLGLRTPIIIKALSAGFGVQVDRLTFLSLGEDARSHAYRVEAVGGSTYFLKVRSGADNPPGARVPAYLNRRGVPRVLAPLPGGDDEPFVRVGDFTVMLYPMLDAVPGAQVGLSPEQWRELGGTVKQVHTVAPVAELHQLVDRETFRPTRRELIEDLETLSAAGLADDPVAQDLGDFWRARERTIRWLVHQTDAMGLRRRQASFDMVLCHGDLHTWNVMVDTDDQLWIVDWDEAILAPKERDLMFVIRGIRKDLVQPQNTQFFLEGYGETTIDQHLLAYYRCAWAVQDIAAYAEQVFLTPALSEVTRRAAADGFMDLFEPGNIVDLALDQS